MHLSLRRMPKPLGAVAGLAIVGLGLAGCSPGSALGTFTGSTLNPADTLHIQVSCLGHSLSYFGDCIGGASGLLDGKPFLTQGAYGGFTASSAFPLLQSAAPYYSAHPDAIPGGPLPGDCTSTPCPTNVTLYISGGNATYNGMSGLEYSLQATYPGPGTVDTVTLHVGSVARDFTCNGCLSMSMRPGSYLP